VRVEGRQHIEAALRQKRGLLLIGFHFTNWEVTGVVAQALMRQVVAIARPMKNPWVEKWIQSQRAAGGMEIILHRQAAKAALRSLRQGRTVGILVDQNLYTGGIFARFFGRPAATTTLPALLHERTGAPIVITYSLRENGAFRVVYEPPLAVPPAGRDPDARVASITQAINDQIEKVVRRRPENWFWIHNRWKRHSR
jgi:KDO2-lipid IV(A) lauroyltransferase